MTRDELILRDLELLEETRQYVEEGAALGFSVPRDPRWGRNYDPMAIIFNPESHTVHFQVALVNIRLALHPEEHWGKCANCGRIYCAGEFGSTVVCSPECFQSYEEYIGSP